MSNTQALAELNEVRKQNEELRRQIEELRAKESPYGVPDLAGLDEPIRLQGRRSVLEYDTKDRWECTTTWGHLFAEIGPYLMNTMEERSVRSAVARLGISLSNRAELSYQFAVIAEEVFHTLKIQLMALGLILVADGRKGEMLNREPLWSLSEKGRRTLFNLRTVRITSAKDAEDGHGPYGDSREEAEN